MTLVEDRCGDLQGFRELSDEFRRFEDVPGLGYAARYQQARCLVKAGDLPAARQHFRELYEQSVEQHMLPAIDEHFHRAFREGNAAGADEERALFLAAAERLKQQGHRAAILALAWQTHHGGNRGLAEELFATAMNGVSDDERPHTTLAAVAYLWQTEQFVRADAMFQPLLADDAIGQSALFWRLGAALAAKHGNTARSVACLDRAIDLEYRALPNEVTVDAVRTTFGDLLNRYQTLADAIATLSEQPSPELVSRVVRAADRWRAIDPDDTSACHAASRVLRRLGDHERAWEYLTTPLAERPAESPAWLSLAQTLRGQSEFDLADRCYVAAFDASPTNAQVLWDRAVMLDQCGRRDAAQQLFRQIAEGQWPAEYQALQEQARKLQPAP